MQPLLLQCAMTALVNTSYALMIGVLAARVWLRRMAGREVHGVQQTLALAMGLGFAVGAGALLLSLWQASATMADVPLRDSGPRLWAMFFGTSYGRFGLASFAILAAGAALHSGLRGRSQGSLSSAALFCLFVLFALCRVATGHAAEHGRVSVAVEFVHVLSMALWLGAVLVAAWVILPKVATAQASAQIDTYLAVLSSWATIALAGVLTTGLYNAFRVLNTPAELVSTEYGWLLTTKLLFVGVAVALGGWNRFLGVPAVVAAVAVPDACSKNLRVLTLVLRVESIALLLVLVAAAVLTVSAPPASH